MKIRSSQTVPKFSDDDKLKLAHDASPKIWKDELEASNTKLSDMSMADLTSYFKKIEKKEKRKEKGKGKLKEK